MMGRVSLNSRPVVCILLQARPYRTAIDGRGAVHAPDCPCFLRSFSRAWGGETGQDRVSHPSDQGAKDGLAAKLSAIEHAGQGGIGARPRHKRSRPVPLRWPHPVGRSEVMLRKLVLLTTLICAACQAPAALTAAPATTPAVVIETAIIALVAPTSTPDCLAVTGVVMAVHPGNNNHYELQASGLQPGEIPFVFYSAHDGRGNLTRMEDWGFVQGAGADGKFSLELVQLRVLDGEPSTTWDVRLVHARGVACATVVVP